jgi:hypothetical protein
MPPINDTVWGAIVGTIVGGVMGEYNMNKANVTGSNNNGTTSTESLGHKIVNYFNEYSTSVLALSTVGLMVVTFYYAMQTRALTRNQLRPYLSVSLKGRQQSGGAYEIWLNMLNVGHGSAFDVLVEYSIRGVRKSVRTDMTRVIPSQMDHSIQLKKMPEGQPLLHDRGANRIIKCKLTFEGTSGRYNREKTLDENEYFAREYGL